MDLVTPAFRAASALAQRLPRPIVEGIGPPVAALWSRRATPRRQMVERHQRRVAPDLSEAELRRRVTEVYRSYGRYYAESFRLPAVGDAELGDRIEVPGYHHIENALATGLGPILALPHLGSWEWPAYWLVRVKRQKVTVAVERLDPPALFEWFAEFRRKIGMHIVPLGPEAGRGITDAVKAGHIVPLLCDRDIGGGGVEVEFFGERTTLPAGPATLAMRTGAALLPVGMYDLGDGQHRAVVRPPLATERRGKFRADVTRVTQDMACVFEELIREAPQQWHLLQPNWPSDYALLGEEPGQAAAKGSTKDNGVR